jgi:hypothetical protein
MNCVECRDKLVACAEGLLGQEESLQCQAHVQACAGCRIEFQAITNLQKQLIARGQAAASVALAQPVMRRVLQKEPERITIMNLLLKTRWGLGLGAGAVATAIVLISLLGTPKTQAAAAEVMTKGAQAVANLAGIHVRGQMRTHARDNFSSINADYDFSTIELWKQLGPSGTAADTRWRVEKSERIAVMDGQSTMLLIKPDMAMKFPHPSSSAFDTGWLLRMASLSDTITNELQNALAKGWKLSLEEQTGADGRAKSVVTIHANSGLPDNDYQKNKFFDTADTRRVYHFDAQTGQLEGVEIYLVQKPGETQIFALTQIDYNPPLDPSLWQLELPSNVTWAQEPQKLPDNEKYASMTAAQAARAFFEACGQKNWDEAGKFMWPMTDRAKQYLGGLQIISLGEPFGSQKYPGQMVPYEIQLSDGTVKKFNLAIRKDNPAGRWQVDGGI